jgi:hypothetical protein
VNATKKEVLVRKAKYSFFFAAFTPIECSTSRCPFTFQKKSLFPVNGESNFPAS